MTTNHLRARLAALLAKVGAMTEGPCGHDGWSEWRTCPRCRAALSGRYHKQMRVNGPIVARNWLSWLSDEEQSVAMEPDEPDEAPGLLAALDRIAAVVEAADEYPGSVDFKAGCLDEIRAILDGLAKP